MSKLQNAQKIVNDIKSLEKSKFHLRLIKINKRKPLRVISLKKLLRKYTRFTLANKFLREAFPPTKRKLAFFKKEFLDVYGLRNLFFFKKKTNNIVKQISFLNGNYKFNILVYNYLKNKKIRKQLKKKRYKLFFYFKK
jgi:hypothetical protein